MSPSGGFEDLFCSGLVGIEKTWLGEKANARVIATLHNIRLIIADPLILVMGVDFIPCHAKTDQICQAFE
jgi:hypothetical protein